MSLHNSNSNSRKSKLLIRSSKSAEVQTFMDLSSASSNYYYPSYRAKTMMSPFKFFLSPFSSISSILRSFLPTIQSLLIPTCRSSPTATSRLTATFFGQKRGRVSFTVQETPRSEPILLLEFAIPTAHLVKEMASGTVRILLECERNAGTPKTVLLEEPMWTVYCDGHKMGYAVSRRCTASDLRVLGTLQAVSVGAGVMPAGPTELMPATLPVPQKPTRECGSEVMYMRAKFERVIGNRNSEAFYMINPDCSGKYNSGGPELSIFLLRI